MRMHNIWRDDKRGCCLYGARIQQLVTQCKILATTPLIEMSALAILETADSE